MKGARFVLGILLTVIASSFASAPIEIVPSQLTVGAGVPIKLSSYTLSGVRSIQWLRNGAPIPGAPTNQSGSIASLYLTNTTAADSGAYSIQASNSSREVVLSEPAFVRVVPPVRFRTLSTLSFPEGFISLQVRDNRAFIAATALHFYDLADPSNPVLLGSYTNSAAWIYNVAAQGNFAVAAGGGGPDSFADLLSLENPAQPVVLATIEPGDTVYDLAIRGDFLYLVGGETLQIWNIAHPESPVLVGRLAAGVAFRLDLSNDLACIGAPNNGLLIVDVAQASAPKLLAKTPVSLIDDVQMLGDRIYVTGLRLSVYDAANLRAPRLLNQPPLLVPNLAHQNSIVGQGAYIFVGNADNRLSSPYFLSAFEVSDPNNLVEAGRHPFDSIIGVHSLDMAGNLLFLAGRDRVEIVEWLPAAEAPVVLRDVGTNRTVIGAPARLEAQALGQENLAFQWFKGSTELAGQTNAALRLPAVTQAESGAYTVRIRNSVGSVTSTGALELIDPPAFAPALGFGPQAKLRLNLPKALQFEVEASEDLRLWRTIWQGEGSAEEIEIADPQTNSWSTYRLRFGNR